METEEVYAATPPCNNGDAPGADGVRSRPDNEATPSGDERNDSPVASSDDDGTSIEGQPATTTPKRRIVTIVFCLNLIDSHTNSKPNPSITWTCRSG